MIYLINIIEPLLEVLAYSIFIGVRDKKKQVVAFLLLYGAVIVKQIYGERIFITCLLPFFSFIFIPILVYRMKLNWINVKIQLSLFTTFLVSDGIIALIYASMRVMQSDYKTYVRAQIVTLIIKLIELSAYLTLAWAIKISKRSIPEMFAICCYGICSIVSTWIAMFVMDDKSSMKYLAYFCPDCNINRFHSIFVLFVETAYETGKTGYSYRRITNKILRHDMKKHMGLMFKLLQDDKRKELEEYMKEMQIEINRNTVCTSSNVVLADLVNYVHQESLKYQIDFQYVLLTEKLPLSYMKQNILLQNILANALESCMRCPADRYIRFVVRPTDYNEVIIECKNSCLAVN